MRRYITLLLLLCATLALEPMPASASDTILTGRPHFPGGGVPAGYTLTLYNPYYARDLTTSTLIIPRTVNIRLDATGAIPVSPAVHVPDVATLAPGNTYYRASFTDLFGHTTTWGNLVITGATLDIGTLIPTPITPPNFWTGINSLTVFRNANKFASIQAAVADAGSTGALIIPGDHSLTETYSNGGNIPVVDLRGANSAELRLWSQLGPSYPIVGYPFGNDMRINSRGPADLYLDAKKLTTTTASNLIVGVNANVLVGAVTLVGAAGVPEVTGTTALLSPQTGAGLLYVGRGTPNFETVTNYTLVDATHVTMTCANPHTGPVDIEQVGSIILNAWRIVLSSSSSPTSAANKNGVFFYDGDQLNPILGLPANSSANFPYNSIQVGRPITGVNATDVVIQNSSGGTSFKVKDHTNTNTLFSVNDAGALAAFLSITSPSLKASGSPRWATDTASNTDVTGELSFVGATTATYPFSNTYTSHPECWATPQFDPVANTMWITYTAATSFTINFSGVVTGSVSYGCTGRN
jgi:hypothetical protein